MTQADIARRLQDLGVQVFERGWLSSNGILCAVDNLPTVLIDTGYDRHADMTTALVRQALQSRTLDCIINTHLHADHCGGNAALQACFPAIRTLVPSTVMDAVRRWDQSKLTYARTLQNCARFRVDDALSPGDQLVIGHHVWQVHSAPGHDPDAIMLFQDEARVLVSGDALWERRLAIIFPELEGESGFLCAEESLDAIERLKPDLVIPGHGRPFSDVAEAIEGSRARLRRFKARPADHRRHAGKALLAFHMLEHGTRPETEVIAWYCSAPILHSIEQPTLNDAMQSIQSLVDAGILHRHDGNVSTQAKNSNLRTSA